MKATMSFFVRPVGQILLMAITATTVYVVSWQRLIHFRSFDPSPSVQEKDSSNRPSSRVHTGLFINNFLEFDLLKNKLQADGILWFRFNKNEVSEEVVAQAAFSKADFKLQGVLSSSAKPLVTKEDSWVTMRYPVVISFASNLNHRLFPIDAHRLYLTLNNKYLTDKNVEFAASDDGLQIASTSYTPGWRLVAKQVRAGMREKVIARENGNVMRMRYPRVIFSLDFTRSSFKYIFLMILPLFVTLFMALFTFSYDYTKYAGNILTICSATIAAMIGFRFVITNSSPQVPYFMFIEYMFAVFLALSFLIFLVNVFQLFANDEMKGTFIFSVHTVLVVAWCLFLML